MSGVVPPRSVYLACQRGLRRWDRMRVTCPDHTGGTSASVVFAELVADGFPVDAATAAEVLEAHRLLDTAPRHPDGESEQQIIARLLWGGDDAPEWAVAVIDADRREQTPDPVGGVHVAAAVGDDDRVLDRLADDLFTIDSETITALRSAFWVAYRTALRAATSTARARSFRIPKADQIAAGLVGTELDDARAAMVAAGPHRGYQAMPDSIAAVISLDLDAAVEGSLDDFEEVVIAILLAALADARRAVADGLGVAVETVVGVGVVDGVRDAARQLRSDLHGWVRDRLDGDRLPEDLGEVVVPEGFFASALSTAGGAAAGDEGDSLSSPIAEAVLVAVASGGVTASALTVGGAGQSVAGAARSAVDVARSVVGRIPRPRRVYTWVRGNPSEPYPDHEFLDGRTWTTDEERFRAVGNERPRVPHPHCRCRIKVGWTFS